MKCLRIILTQTSANYRKEETDKNKMTYPLPPFSTIIGALHKACGYTETRNMDISIQGTYQSMGKEVYRDYVYFNSTFDDRGNLIKMQNADNLCGAYREVAQAKKSQGNSFEKDITIDVKSIEDIESYRALKKLDRELESFKNTRLKIVVDKLKAIKNKYAALKKSSDKNSPEFNKYKIKEKKFGDKIKFLEDSFKAYKLENCTIPLTKFRNVNTSVKYYEVLYGIKLIIHISAEEQVLEDIFNNIYNLKSIGRSEDFVNVESIEYVELSEEIDDEVKSSNSAYLSLSAVRNDLIFTRQKKHRTIIGTRYNLNKLYVIENNKRIFNDKKAVIYASDYTIDECSPEYGIYYDGEYIVNLI